MYCLRDVERKADIVFLCTSDLGCVFCLPEISFFGKRIALCTRRGAFLLFKAFFVESARI